MPKMEKNVMAEQLASSNQKHETNEAKDGFNGAQQTITQLPTPGFRKP